MARAMVAASSQFLSVASVPATAVPISMACWFQSSDLTLAQGLICLSEDAAKDDNFLLYMAAGGGSIKAESKSGGTPVTSTTATGVTVNTWTHAAAVFTSSTSRHAYINGTQATISATANTPTAPNVTLIGCSVSTPLVCLTGTIALVGIWNVALTATEVKQLALGWHPLKVRSGSLVTFLPMSAGEDYDQKGGNTFTAAGTPTNAVDPPGIRYSYPRGRRMLRYGV